MKIQKGDQVKVTVGKDKSRTGEVISVMVKSGKVVVKGLNLFKRHFKAQGNKPGSVVEKERGLDVSKVVLICPNCNKNTRVGYQIDKSGTKNRFCKKCKQVISPNFKK